jgi:hypothetical protein
MPMDTTPLSDTHALQIGLERLRQDLRQLPADPDRERDDASSPGMGPIDYAAMEFEVERLRKRLAIWEIFMAYVRDGARTWPDVQRALTPQDLDTIVAICDGEPLRDVLLHLR